MRTLRKVWARHCVAGWISDQMARPHPGLAGIAIGLAVFALLVVGGALDQLQATLGAMGFDTDRARLLVALLMGASVAAAAGFTSRTWTWGVLGSLATLVACFAATFVNETQAAIASPAHDFDVVGWAVAALSLASAAALIGWATATLGIHARSRVDALTATISAARMDRSQRSAAWRAVVRAVAVLVSLMIAVPAFGDMVNFAPDVSMHHAAPAGPALVAATGRDGNAAGPRGDGPPVTQPGLDPSMVAGPLPGSGVTAGAISADAPWSTHPPSGSGQVVTIGLPAPWVGGILPTALVDVYLPPGYDASTTRRYPVVYSAPWGMEIWDRGAGIRGQLDRLVTSGALPPAIFVFASDFGALYASSECTDSYDGRQWFERYIVETVVPYVDVHYRTLPWAAGRSLLGYSEGAYCAASLLVRHPDVFGQAAALSGYYHAALRSASTPTAWRVFGGDAARIAAGSPALAVGTLSATTRNSLFIVLEAQPDEPLFGSEYAGFAAALAGAGIAHATIPVLGVGHSWPVVRATLETVLRLLVGRQVRMGVSF